MELKEKELTDGDGGVCWSEGFELSSYTAHLKSVAVPLVTLRPQRQVGFLCKKSRSPDSSER